MTHETDGAALQDILQRGDFAVLIGTPEGEWNERKREPYQRSDERSKLELSKDVGALASADGGVTPP